MTDSQLAKGGCPTSRLVDRGASGVARLRAQFNMLDLSA